MYNLTDVTKNTNNINKTSTNIQRVARNVLSSSVELNFNSPKINSLKSKLENNTTPLNLNSNNKKIMFPLLGNKSPILMKEKMGNLPGVIIYSFIIKIKIFFDNFNP
jgi:hypothetical protein